MDCFAEIERNNIEKNLLIMDNNIVIMYVDNSKNLHYYVY